MKELSIEGKATRYDQALERARAKYVMKDQPIHQDLVDIFPELAESEDEGVCKKLIAFLKQCKGVYGDGFKQFGLDIDDALAWLEKQGEKEEFIKKELECIRGYRDEAIRRLNELEKQGEQNLAWSKEDEDNLNSCITKLEIDIQRWGERGKTMVDGDEKLIHWLKSLKDRIQPQPMQEWSEEDEIKIRAIITIISSTDESIMNSLNQSRKPLCDWLKFLRPQSHWKPSEGQMKALWDSIPKNVMEISEREMLLDSLYQELKKLREE